MIILAGAVILTLINSDLISDTQKGLINNNASNYKAELATNLSAEQLNDTDFITTNVEAYTYEDIVKYIPSMKAGDEAKFAIQAGQLVYIGEDETEILAMREIDINQGFLQGEEYATVYLNPNAKVDPNNLIGADEINVGLEDDASNNVIFYVQDTGNKVIIKKRSTEGAQLQSMILICDSDGNVTNFYIFETFVIEGLGTFTKGWYEIDAEGVPIKITDSAATAITINLGTIASNDETALNIGCQYLQFYFSTVPYTI